VARWADEFNRVGGTPQKVRESFGRVREAVDRAGRDQRSVRTSLMTWVFVGRTEREWTARADRARTLDPSAGPPEAYLEDVSKDFIVGTVDRAVERMNEYAAAGVQRFILNHGLFDDLDQIELIATEILPKIDG